MELEDFVNIIKEDTAIDAKTIKSVLFAIAPAIKELKDQGDDRLRINNLGVFTLRKRSAKKLHNVTTNTISAYEGYTTLFFNADKKFLTKINEK